MSRGRQKVSFEGLLQENMLGMYTIIRGFADLRDLIEVSKAMQYQGSKNDQGSGYQRQIDEQHVKDIKRFLSEGRSRFFPEIILSLRSTGKTDPIVSYTKRRASSADNAYRVSVNIKALRADNFTRIRRIDGNHRLEAAKSFLDEQKRSATFKHFSKAPFCFVVLNSDKPDDDELTEALLFNLINSKALPITSEHSFSVLMRAEGGTPAERFEEDPQLYLTRLIRDRVKNWPGGFYDAMGDTPLSRLHSAAGVLLRPGGISKASWQDMEADVESLFDPLYELAVRLRDKYEEFVHSSAFLSIAAEVYARYSKVDPAKGANTELERIHRAERWLRDFARWFDRVGGAELPLPADPTVLWTVFKRDFDKRAGQVFVAMSFRESKMLEGIYKAVEEALYQFNDAHPNTPLAPVRIDKQHGASYEIPARVFHDIDQSRLVIADLTDERPNVYCEVGYAKAQGIPFFLTFHRQVAEVSAVQKVDLPNKIHLDLAPYRYIEYDNPLELRDRLKKELDAWHNQQP